MCEIVPKSFDNIKQIERYPSKISLFDYDTTYSLYVLPQTVHQHRSTELAAIFVGMLTSLSAAT